MGLKELVSNSVYKERYLQFVTLMIFGESHVSWEDAYACLRKTALDVIDAYRQRYARLLVTFQGIFSLKTVPDYLARVRATPALTI